MIAIIDYGMGNLRSVQKALEKVGAQAIITQKPEGLTTAKKIVLPGVGAIQPAMAKLMELDLIQPIKDSIAQNNPFLGICVGFQLLFETTTEGGKGRALGLLKGSVERFSNDVKVPQMGWNQININPENNILFQGIADKSYVYFCHSYYAKPDDHDVVSTTTDYGVSYASSIVRKNLFGVQFHPEKSQDVGLKILKNFVEI